MGARHIGSVGIVCCVPVIMVASQVDGWHLCETCTRHRLANSARLNCRAKTSNTVIRFPRASEAVSHSKIPFARRVAGAHRRHTAGGAGRRAGGDAGQACRAGRQKQVGWLRSLFHFIKFKHSTTFHPHDGKAPWQRSVRVASLVYSNETSATLIGVA